MPPRSRMGKAEGTEQRRKVHGRGRRFITPGDREAPHSGRRRGVDACRVQQPQHHGRRRAPQRNSERHPVRRHVNMGVVRTAEPSQFRRLDSRTESPRGRARQESDSVRGRPDRVQFQPGLRVPPHQKDVGDDRRRRRGHKDTGDDNPGPAGKRSAEAAVSTHRTGGAGERRILTAVIRRCRRRRYR